MEGLSLAMLVLVCRFVPMVAELAMGCVLAILVVLVVLVSCGGGE